MCTYSQLKKKYRKFCATPPPPPPPPPEGNDAHYVPKL